MEPFLSRNISSYFLPDVAKLGKDYVARPEPPDERTPLLIARSSSDTALNRPPSSSTAEYTIQRALERPTIHRAASTSLIVTHIITDSTLSAMSQGHPSLMRRATQGITQQLELGQSSSAAHRNRPEPPTSWNGNTHRQYLIIVWDKIVEVAATNSKYPKSPTAQLVAAQQTMLRKFPELGQGKVTLSGDWMEYVLGVALRHPFCTAERMGRWEVLASSGGSRATWGPW